MEPTPTPTSSNNGPPGEIVRLATAVKAFYERYVAFHSEHRNAQAGCMALFTFYTHVYDEFRFAPMILVTAPTSEAGKSRLFDVAELLVRAPYVVVDPSGPALRNIINMLHPTLMIDETDLLTKSPDLKVILNAGVEKGRSITRATRGGGVDTYDPFSPKMFAGIYGEAPPLKGATLSRCIQIGLRRRNPVTEPIADFNKNDAELESLEIVSEVKRWSLLVSKEELRKARPEMPAELTDRQRDAWLPLIVIADLISELWGAAARTWAVELSRAVPVTPDIMVQVLRDVHQVLAAYDGTRVTSRVLADLRNALEDREFDGDLNAIELGKRLARFGIHPTKWNISGGRKGKQERGFIFRRGDAFTAEFKDAFERYGITA
jgi:hypothetical protein